MTTPYLNLTQPNFAECTSGYSIFYQTTHQIMRNVVYNTINEGLDCINIKIRLNGCLKPNEAGEESLAKIHTFFDNNFDKGPQFIEDRENFITMIINSFTDKIYIEFKQSTANECITANLLGDKSEIERIIPILCDNFGKFEKAVKQRIGWCMSNSQGGIDIKYNELEVKQKPFTEMYPFLQEESLEDYYERFGNSNASILLLKGPPGTGKTTFIRGLLQHLKKDALLSYDEEILRSDNFLNLFIKKEDIDYLIFEDADAYLSSRETGNRTLFKFLNAGDGLISSSKKKIIFTTNLENLSDIDSALIRPGRCFDILEFRPLTKQEALVVTRKQGLEAEFPEQQFTIAEIFNSQKYTKKKETRSIGFLM